MADVLEDSGIAWPHPAMWSQMPQQIYSISPPRKAKARRPDPHGLSPGRRAVSNTGTCPEADKLGADPESSHGLKGLPSYQDCETQYELEDSQWPPMPAMPDPFVDDSRFQSHKKLARDVTSNAQSMPDCYSVESNTSNPIAAHNVPAFPESQFDELMASYSPRKDTRSGTFAAANTRAGSSANTPPTRTSSFCAAEPNSSLYSHKYSRSVSVTTRDPQLKAFRMPSDTSTTSSFSESSMEASELPGKIIRKNPAKYVKSRREGTSSEFEPGFRLRRNSSEDSLSCRSKENQMRDADDPIVISDGKRKRANTRARPKLHIRNGDGNFSPTRKVSRVEGKGELDESVVDYM